MEFVVASAAIGDPELAILRVADRPFAIIIARVVFPLSPGRFALIAVLDDFFDQSDPIETGALQ